jgi:hypothetical protein
MAAAASAAVRGAHEIKTAEVVRWHLAGLTLGATAIVGLAWGLGSLVPRPATGAFIAVTAAIWGTAALAGRSLWLPSSPRQVPLGWRYAMTPHQYLFSYGLGLGFGLATRVLTISLFVLLAMVMWTGEAPIAGIAVLFYSLARGTPVAMAVTMNGRSEPTEAILESNRGLMLRLDGLAVIAAGIAVVAVGI